MQRQTIKRQPPAVTQNQQIVHKIHRHARLSAAYDAKGEFRAWRIIEGMVDGNDVRRPISAEFGCDEMAWADAAMKTQRGM